MQGHSNRTPDFDNGFRRRSSQCAAFGVVAFMLALFCTVGFCLPYPVSVLKSFAIVPRPPFIPADDPSVAAQAGLPPVAASQNPSPSEAVRAILIRPHSVSLDVGGVVIATVPVKNESLPVLATAVRVSGWITEPTPGVFDVRAPLIFLPGSNVTVSQPAVQRIVLYGDDGAFIAFIHSRVLLYRVEIQSVHAAHSSPLRPRFRPFIEFERSTSFQVDGCHLVDLGWDWNASYGLSFMSGSSGTMSGSTVKGNFIGVYVDHSHHILLWHNVFENSELYGVDPHSYSFELSINGNLVQHNAAHGIVFSNHVTSSVVQNNVSRSNGENGIMMDDRSNDNLIAQNQILGNRGDGVTLSNSPDNQVFGNVIVNNRFGVSLFGIAHPAPSITANRIDNNGAVSQGVAVSAASNSARGNSPTRVLSPPPWTRWLLVGVWLVTLSIFLVSWRRRRSEPRGGGGGVLSLPAPREHVVL